MKRIVSVIAVAALMAVMVGASAMPAFAAVKTTRTGNLQDCFTLNGAICSGTTTSVGGSGSKGGGSGGKSTVTTKKNNAIDPAQRSFYESGSSQGGGKGTGGGNCTYTIDSTQNPRLSSSGHGNRC